MKLSLTEKEAKVFRACLAEGSKLMLRLLRSPHADEVTKAMANHDRLVIITLFNKIDTLLQKMHKMNSNETEHRKEQK